MRRETASWFSHQMIRASGGRIDLDRLAMLGEFERPGGWVLLAVVFRLGELDTNEVERRAVDPEIDGDRIADHCVRGDAVDQRLRHVSMNMRHIVACGRFLTDVG